MNQNNKIVIIGGGLSGLTLAYLLSKHNIKTTLLEGSNRFGGRIQTHNGKLETPLELGATWFSDSHLNLIELLKELKLNKYPQYTAGKSLFQTHATKPPQVFHVPPNENPSYRISGGTESLITKLKSKISDMDIRLNTKVTSIENQSEEIIIKTSVNKTYHAHKVILCLPPNLAYHSIKFLPELPERLSSVLPNVQTWMAGCIKFVLEYKAPFWRKQGFSGMFYSHTSIVMEMYDHTNVEQNKFGFTGFLNPNFSTQTKIERQKIVVNQLSEIFGAEIKTPVSYFDKVWTGKHISITDPFQLNAHQNNGHPVLNGSYMDSKLYFSGTETSNQFGGYMEGAIISAKSVVSKIV